MCQHACIAHLSFLEVVPLFWWGREDCQCTAGEASQQPAHDVTTLSPVPWLLAAAVSLPMQYTHPAWEGFDVSKLHEEYAKLEAEKQAYLAAKAAAGPGARH